MNPLKLLQNSLFPNYSGSPLDAVMSGKPEEFTPRFSSRVSESMQDTPENRKAFTNSLLKLGMGATMNMHTPYNVSVDAMTSKPMGGPPLARPGVNKLPSATPPAVSTRIPLRGGASMPSQSDPIAKAYEAAMNQMDIPMMNSIMKAHPGDARFAVHLMLK